VKILVSKNQDFWLTLIYKFIKLDLNSLTDSCAEQFKHTNLWVGVFFATFRQ